MADGRYFEIPVCGGPWDGAIVKGWGHPPMTASFPKPATIDGMNCFCPDSGTLPTPLPEDVTDAIGIALWGNLRDAYQENPKKSMKARQTRR